MEGSHHDVSLGAAPAPASCSVSPGVQMDIGCPAQVLSVTLTGPFLSQHVPTLCHYMWSRGGVPSGGGVLKLRVKQREGAPSRSKTVARPSILFPHLLGLPHPVPPCQLSPLGHSPVLH